MNHHKIELSHLQIAISKLTAALSQIESQQSRELGVKPIKMSFLASIVAGIFFSGIKVAAENIEPKELRETFEFFIDKVEIIVNILTDSDKENAAQLSKFFKENGIELGGDLIQKTIGIIQVYAKECKLKDQIIQWLSMAVDAIDKI